ncbi:hypothetical protein [Streptomyces sp. NPDC047999]|uniref:Rubredoxin n=1 Tax=Streptomyces sanyensis TaxID=568869 RepID=A0ABP9ATS0_9ACTN
MHFAFVCWCCGADRTVWGKPKGFWVELFEVPDEQDCWNCGATDETPDPPWTPASPRPRSHHGSGGAAVRLLVHGVLLMVAVVRQRDDVRRPPVTYAATAAGRRANVSRSAASPGS